MQSLPRGGSDRAPRSDRPREVDEVDVVVGDQRFAGVGVAEHEVEHSGGQVEQFDELHRRQR